jgi:hypothetical protein
MRKVREGEGSEKDTKRIRTNGGRITAYRALGEITDINQLSLVSLHLIKRSPVPISERHAFGGSWLLIGRIG